MFSGDSDSEVEISETDRNIAGEFHSGFISGWENDTEGIEEENQPHESPEKEIFWAAENGNAELAKKLLSKNKNLVHCKDKDSYTPLHRAAYNNHLNVLNVLIEHGADIHAETNDKWTAFHSACHWNSFQCALQLSSLDIDVNRTTQGGITALHFAAGNNTSLETLQMLLLHPDIDPSIKNNSNETAYEIAARSGRFARFFEAAEPCFNFI